MARCRERRDRSDDVTVRHGTVLGYASDRCSCERCRRAWRAYYNAKKPRPPDRQQSAPFWRLVRFDEGMPPMSQPAAR